jgi:hypothetical protein
MKKLSLFTLYTSLPFVFIMALCEINFLHYFFRVCRTEGFGVLVVTIIGGVSFAMSLTAWLLLRDLESKTDNEETFSYKLMKYGAFFLTISAFLLNIYLLIIALL